jgi:DNA-binding NarL/FixJ family response regulator
MNNLTKVPIRLIIPDDHEVVLEGLAAMFSQVKEIDLVAQATNGKQLVELVEKHCPDVVLTDIQMDIMDGIEATRIIHKHFPGIGIVALSVYESGDKIGAMLSAGAIGYVVKNAKKEVVLAAIMAVYTREPYYCRRATAGFDALVSLGLFDKKNMESIELFTGIEKIIFEYICQEMDSKTIAEKIGKSVSTVNKYREGLMEKTGAKNLAGLIMFGVKNGIL